MVWQGNRGLQGVRHLRAAHLSQEAFIPISVETFLTNLTANLLMNAYTPNFCFALEWYELLGKQTISLV